MSMWRHWLRMIDVTVFIVKILVMYGAYHVRLKINKDIFVVKYFVVYPNLY